MVADLQALATMVADFLASVMMAAYLRERPRGIAKLARQRSMHDAGADLQASATMATALRASTKMVAVVAPDRQRERGREKEH
ncbi:hypothetical protein L484_026939 [Morus notabilis]|uniref:Uncharacterized protein n=1 Tax=Morus notabilis TaxID=981085 RepID=W9R0Z9_9ROSA|nr:hypothetical protein L484_026939 [Morus notabilis]